MTKDSVRRFVHSTTARLSASYLGIIMVLSIAFSYVIYKTSAHELGRQIPPPSMFQYDPNFNGTVPNFGHFFQRRIAEGQGDLLGRLIVLNLCVLVIGAALSYFLARRTLEPIENAMEAQSRFVTDASHELRTPITAILASNEVALRKPRLTLAQAKQIIHSNTEEMVTLKNLSDGLLSLSKQDGTIVKKPVSLQTIAAEAMNRVLPAAQLKHITVQDSVPAVKVPGDLAGLTQAVTALLDNAVKYSPEGSTVHLVGHKQDGYGYLTVKDKGIGIAARDLPHIFDRFYRADPARTATAAGGSGGHGIGLAIARQVVEQHEGRLTVASAPNHGSTFTLQLPLA